MWRAGPASRDSSKASTLKDPLRVHARAAVASREVVEGICPAELAGVDQAHEQIPSFGAVQRAIEQSILAVQHSAFERAFTDVMPTAGLCRVGVEGAAVPDGSRILVVRFVGIITGSPGKRVKGQAAGSGQVRALKK